MQQNSKGHLAPKISEEELSICCQGLSFSSTDRTQGAFEMDHRLHRGREALHWGCLISQT